MMKFLMIVALIYSFPHCSAQASQSLRFDSSILSAKGQQAYEALLETETFHVGDVSIGGYPSGEEKALHALLEEEAAVEACRSLIEHATPEGALYGLLGLHIKDQEVFQQEIECYRMQAEPAERVPAAFAGLKTSEGKPVTIAGSKVMVQRGCMVSREERLDVVRRIEVGDYDDEFNLSAQMLSVH